MLSKKKKIFIVAGFCILLALTGVLNLVINSSISDDVIKTNTTTTANFFQTYREDRVDARNEEMLYLDAIIASSSSSAEAKQSAEEKKAEILATIESELTLESLIKAKGFDDVIVTTAASNINVVVQSAELTSTEVAQIVDVIQNQTDYTLDNIKIIPLE